MVPTAEGGVKPNEIGQFARNRPYSDEAAAVTNLLLLLAAVLGAAVIVLIVLLVRSLRRSPRAGGEQVSAVVATLEQRMEELAAELAAAVARAEEEGRRARLLSDISGSIDLDDVALRTLDAALSVAGGDAALMFLEPQGEGSGLTVGHGIASEGARPIGGPPDGAPASSVYVRYAYESPEEGQIHAGLAVPLANSAGSLAVYSRTPNAEYTSQSAAELEMLAGHATPALHNAQEFREARQLADLDALTGLHNRRYFHEMLARECARAHRYDRRLALIVFDLDDFKDVNDRIGHLAGDAVLAEAGERVRSVIRAADVPCRVGGDEFAVVMPESGLEQAEQLFERLQAAMSGRPIGQAGRLQISAGLAELKADDDSVSFFERADHALYRAKDAGKNRSFVADGHAAA
jgi:diguanylate cyclase (GGDEF)-like protein